ncbi:epoxide hydrolase family protein [Dactylosporangium sp. NPDC000521]|uniref:epoxide hydrolase family protein n=1 Tax=Dactylosporangium sp. NPDC000521 TaxID=3363975 RepID=UPI003699D7FB
MRPFQVDIPESELDDLRGRLAATRWPDAGPGPGWSRGVPLEYLRELADYWRTRFDWRAAEAKLNAHPQFITEIDGATVHFVHVRSRHEGATPIILTHGWPGSVLEFLDLIGPLTDPEAHGGTAEDAFHVVIPTIPGFGFSGPTGQAGWSVARVARAWADLMRSLGYDQYIAQGGDWGKVISLQLGLADAEHAAGVHINMLVTFPPDPAAVASLDAGDLERLGHGAHFAEDGIGWQKIQSTRPQTLAYALTDSPVGQLAWIVEKFYEWTGAVERPEEVIDRDTILSIVTLYWLTATAGSSAQIYYETTPTTADFVATWGGPWNLAMPVAVAVFPHDATRPIKTFAEKALPTLTQWTEHPDGGHFAALEQPEALVADIRTFARTLR